MLDYLAINQLIKIDDSESINYSGENESILTQLGTNFSTLLFKKTFQTFPISTFWLPSHYKEIFSSPPL